MRRPPSSNLIAEHRDGAGHRSKAAVRGRRSALAGLMVLALTAAGCGSGDAAGPVPGNRATSEAPGGSDDGAAGNRTAGAGGAGGVAATEFGGTDLAWLQLMIPMDEQLLPVLDLLAQRAGEPELATVAVELRAVYDAELPKLRALGQQAGIPADNPHRGHKMPGLVDADRLASIRGASGAEFERQAVDCLREHLDQLAGLARSELQNGTSPAVKALAGTVADTRTAYRARLPG